MDQYQLLKSIGLCQVVIDTNTILPTCSRFQGRTYKMTETKTSFVVEQLTKYADLNCVLADTNSQPYF